MTSRVLRGSVGFLFLIAAFIGSAAPAFGVKRPLSYSVIPLSTPGTEEAWSPDFFYPEYINNKGDVVGSRGSGVVFYRDGAIHELGYPRVPLEPGWTSGLNDRGDILGCAFGESTVTFVLPSLPRPVPVTEARDVPVLSFRPTDFNNYGTIVGAIYNREQDTDIPVVYSDGRITVLPPLVSGGYAFPVAVNNRGQILGEATIPDGIERAYGSLGLRAVIWSGRRIHNLGVLPGFYDSYATSINDRGEVVGDCVGWDGFAAFIYRNGVMRQLPFPPGARHTFSRSINERSDVLLHAVPWRPNDEATLPYDSAWLYSDGALHDLASIAAWPREWRIQFLSPFNMNDRGEIIGVVHYLDRSNRALTHGILLVPQHNGNRGTVSRANRPFIAAR